MAHVHQTIRLDQSELAAGAVLGARFRLEAQIGQGGQALVFQAVDLRRGGAPVAVKIARQDLGADARREAEEVLRREAGLLRRLRHPALPRLYGLERGPQRVWLARELVPGQPLNVLARQGPWPWRQVQLWAAHLCDLLTFLHTCEPPVVVGDLKPANLVWRPDGSLALIDLGAAHTLTRRPPRASRPRHGTPGYAPPEQLGGRSFDERADVFALAVTCYELLTGHDPAAAPLQFNFEDLERVAPLLADGLRSALAFDLAERCPTAAVLRSRLGTPAPPRRLFLGGGSELSDRRDLEMALQRAPQALAGAVADGSLERWLAAHPDDGLGALRYRLRLARLAAPPHTDPLDLLLAALAPPEGSGLLQVTPTHLDLGAIPLRSWRVWSQPRVLTLTNAALTPLSWELECPAQPDADVRVLVAGKAQRRTAGVLAAGEQTRLEIVAMGKTGARSSALRLRCGKHYWSIPWEAQVRPGVPLAGRHVERLEDLDLRHPDLAPALEALLEQGVLTRWLGAIQRRDLAREIGSALPHTLDALQRRLLVGRILHTLAPDRFPMLQIRGLNETAARPLIAGEPTYALIEIDNLAAPEVPLVCRSHTSWVEVAAAPATLEAWSTSRIALRLLPPADLHGPQEVALRLAAGALPLTITIPVRINPARWWQRLRRMFRVS
ncbi:MAG: serine/threonine-protein kinase [Oscillochloridaceae bacterium]|nr:serine/threonine protein kinase [Chloroflexaceae bacterium]MDW8390379.1 serine/threonine-protein kinase [Oscillochloridaceae bacterium]